MQQLPSFEDDTCPDHVYKFSKAIYGLNTSRKELKVCGTHKLSLAVSVTARQ
jgi:hypothetical protein